MPETGRVPQACKTAHSCEHLLGAGQQASEALGCVNAGRPSAFARAGRRHSLLFFIAWDCTPLCLPRVLTFTDHPITGEQVSLHISTQGEEQAGE